MVLSYFLGGWETPNPPKNWQHKTFFSSFKLPVWAKPLEARGEAASYDLFIPLIIEIEC